MTTPRDGVRGPGRPPGHTAEATRAALLDAMERQVVESGYDGATTRSVAAEAGVQVANVRHHFGSKAGLFAAGFDRAMGRIADTLVAHLADADGDVTLSSVLRLWGSFAQSQPRTAAFLAIAPVERARRAELRRPVGDAAVELERRVRAEVRSWAVGDPGVVADTLIAMVFGLVVYPSLIDPSASGVAIIETAARLFERLDA